MESNGPLSQLHSPKHAQVIIIILFIDHKATIVAFRSQGVKALWYMPHWIFRKL